MGKRNGWQMMLVDGIAIENFFVSVAKKFK
jgi:hypothetical protein